MQLFACSLCALNHMLLFCRLNASCLHQGVLFRVSGLTGRHVRNLCSRSESGAAGIGKLAARCRGTCPQWKAPLSSRTGVCRAVKPLAWSEHTLNYSHLFTGPSVNVKVTVHWPSAFPPARFFFFQWQGLPSCQGSTSSSHLFFCGGPLNKPLNDSLVFLPQDLSHNSFTDASTQRYCAWPPPSSFWTGQLWTPDGVAQEAIRCTSGWVSHPVQNERAFVYFTSSAQRL